MRRFITLERLFVCLMVAGAIVFGGRTLLAEPELYGGIELYPDHAGLSGGGPVTGPLCMADDVPVYFGGTCSAPYYGWHYDLANTQICLTTFDGDGVGGDICAASIDDGTDDLDLSGDLVCTAVTASGLVTGTLGATISGANLDVQGQMITEGDGTYAPGHSPTGFYTEGSVEIDGVLWCDGGANFSGTDIKNLDDLYGDAVATDAAPRVTVLGTQPIFVEPAATNVTGANLVLAPSPGERTLDDVTLAATTGDTLTFDVYSNGVVSQTVKIEGVDWDCDGAGTDIICVCNLWDDLVSNPITGVVVTRTDATCSDEKLTFTVDPGVSEYLTVTTSDDVNLDMTAGADGQILVTGGTASLPGVTWIEDADGTGTGIYRRAADNLGFATNGIQRWYINNSGQLIRDSGLLNINGGELTLGAVGGYITGTAGTKVRFPADSQLQVCNTAETNCFTLGASADTGTVYDKAGTGAGNWNVSGKSRNTADADTIADSGDGNPATHTLNPTSTNVQLTCSDADTCDVTMGETGTFDGDVVTIVNVSANVCDFADTGGVSELVGAYAMDQWQSLSLKYIVDRWVEMGRSAN